MSAQCAVLGDGNGLEFFEARVGQHFLNLL
jgi:hypothetical protein